MPLLRDGRYYDALHTFMVRDIDYWRSLAGPTPCRILELACGTGRVSIPLARDGHEVFGIDNAESMIDVARGKAGDLPVRFVRADMRDFARLGSAAASDPGFGTFDLVIAPFNALRLLIERADIDACLGCVRGVLRLGGRFAIDVTAPRQDHLVADQPATTHNHVDPIDGTPIVATHVRRYDRFRQLITLDATFRFADGRTDLDQLVQRVYFPQELVGVLAYNAFDVVEMFGDYARTPAGPDSPQLLFVATSRS